MMVTSTRMLLFALSFLSANCLADIAVVVAPHVHIKNLSKQEVTELFFKIRSSTATDIKLMPTDHHDNSLKERFYNACCSRNPLQVKAYWSRLVFSGRARPPDVLPLGTPLPEYLKEHPLTLLYVDTRDVLPGMNVVHTFTEAQQNEAP